MRWGVSSFVVIASTAFVACGGQPPPQAGGERASAGTAVVEDQAYAEWLLAHGVERVPAELGESTRAPARSAARIWPLFPRGDTRPEGLTAYAVEVEVGFPKGGVIQVRRADEVIYQASVPFSPTTRITEGTFPAQVREAVKPGQNLTWGVYFSDDPESNASSRLRIVKKPAAERYIARIDGDPRNARQTELVRGLGRSQVLLNHSLYGEALAGFLAVAQDEPSVGEAWTRVAECLRRLDLDESPLFTDARVRAASLTGKGSSARERSGAETPHGPTTQARAPGAVEPGGGRQVATGRPSMPTPAEARATEQRLGIVQGMASRRHSEAAEASAAAQGALAQARAALADAQAALAQAQASSEAQARAEAARRRAELAEQAVEQSQAREAELRAEAEQMADAARRGLPLTVADRERRAHELTSWASRLRREAEAASARAQELAQRAERAEQEAGPDAEFLRAEADAAAAEALARGQDADAAQERVRELLEVLRPAR